MTSKVAALAINVPFIGDYLSQILSYPTECLGYSEAKDFSKGENWLKCDVTEINILLII